VVQIRPNKPKIADGRHFEKKLKSRYLSNRLGDFDKIGVVTHISLLQLTESKNFEFLKSKMAATAILKKSKNCYPTNGLTDLHEINLWQNDAEWVHTPAVKNFEF